MAKRETTIVGVISDTHCPAMHEGYTEFCVDVFKDAGVNFIVHIGDLVDWHSASYHETIAALKNPDGERSEAQEQVDHLMNAFPWVKRGRRHILIGNHDALPYRKIQTAGLASDTVPPFKEYWNLKGWKVHERFGELIVDDVVYSHGEGKGGVYAHGTKALARGRSCVMGHLHSNAGTIWHANPESRLFGLAVGCGVDNTRLQFMYGRAFPRKPILGCGVVIGGVIPQFVPMLLKSR